MSFRTLFNLICVISLSVGCKDYQPEHYPKTPMPEAPQFDLPDSVTLSGSTMFFKPTIDSDHLALIADTSMYTRLEILKTRQLDQQKTHILEDIRSLEGHFAAYLPNIIDDSLYSRNISILKNSYQEWLAEFSEFENSSFVLLLQNYCEAKLWEYAFREDLDKQSVARPTPSQLCEVYYQSKGFLSEKSELCSQSEETKSYFACLWSEGVLKTDIFKNNFEQDSISIIQNWLKVDPETSLTILQEVLRGRYGNRLTSAAMEFLPLPSSKFDEKLGEYEKVKNVFKSKYESTTSARKSFQFEGVSPKKFLTSVEKSVDQCSEGVCLSSASPVIQNIRSSLQKLTGGILKNKEYPTLNDVLFNKYEVKADSFDMNFFLLLGQDPYINRFLSNQSSELAQIKEISESAIAKRQQILKIQDEIKLSNDMQKDLSLKSAQLIVGQENVAYTFFPGGSSITIRKHSDHSPEYLSIDITMKDNVSKFLRACLNIQEQTQISCPTEVLEVGFDEFMIENPKSIFKSRYFRGFYKIVDPVSIGFSFIPRTSIDPSQLVFTFNDIPEEQMRDKTLVIGVQLNQIEKLVNVATVSLVVIDETNKLLYEGGQALIEY